MILIKKSHGFFNNFKINVFVLSLVAFGAVSGQAQNINDDLQKKPAIQKSSKAVTAKKPKTTARKNSSKKNIARTKETETETPPVQTERIVEKQLPEKVDELPAQPVVERVQSPVEIIERFMNFQQSSGITYRDWENVITRTTETLQANPNDTNAKGQMLIAQAEMAFNKNDYSNALIQFTAASQVLPNFSLPFYGIGKVYLATKQPAQAESSFEKAIKLSKNFALAYKGMGDALTAQNKPKKAQEFYKNAAQLSLASSNLVMAGNVPAGTSPSNQTNTTVIPTPVLQPNVQPLSYEDELKAAQALTVSKKWQDSLNKLLPLTGNNQTADLYLAIGDNYSGLEQWLSAQKAYQKAIELSPESAIAFYKSGLVLFEMNEYQSASEAFEKSLILDQSGRLINRQIARRMADKSSEKARDAKNGKKRIFGLMG